MRIKEVEKETGLTAKAIRLYESKGLLTVERNRGNDYRDYSEEDVKRLKTIAVLRKLEVPISDIRQWADGEVALCALLRRVEEGAEREARNANVRKRLAGELEAALQKEPNKPLDEAIAEAEGLELLLQELGADTRKLWNGCFWPALVTLGTIGWLWNTIQDILGGRFLAGAGSMLLCCVGIPPLVSMWKVLFRRKFWQEIHWKGCLSFLLRSAVGLALVVGSFALLVWCQLHLLDPQAHCYYNTILWVLAGTYPLVAVYHWHTIHRWRTLTAHVGVYLLLVYTAVTWSTAFTGAHFVRYSPLAPQSPVVYELDMVQRVEAGFAESGDFYYDITFDDGWQLDAAAADLYVEGDPWQDLLELDRHLCLLDIKKVTVSLHRTAFPYDPQYLDICDEILERRPQS